MRRKTVDVESDFETLSCEGGHAGGSQRRVKIGAGSTNTVRETMWCTLSVRVIIIEVT